MDTYVPHTEVATSLLIEKFKFEPGPEVDWKMGGLLHPVAKIGNEHRTAVPLKVIPVQ